MNRLAASAAQRAAFSGVPAPRVLLIMTTPTNAMKFAVCDSRVTRTNRRDVEDFVRLAQKSQEQQLKPSESKRFVRLQTRLMRERVVVPVTKKVVTDIARDIYKALPWWKKLSLRVRFMLRMIRVRFDVVKLRLRS
jgi:hypothetical protein